jgi:hypothetical protein
VHRPLPSQPLNLMVWGTDELQNVPHGSWQITLSSVGHFSRFHIGNPTPSFMGEFRINIICPI